MRPMPRAKDPVTGKFVPNGGTQKPVAKAVPKGELRNELGVSQTHHVGRSLYDDYLPQLRGRRAAKVYREMADGDATVGGMLFGIEALLREITWHHEPADDSDQAIEAALYADSCMDDMTHTWGDHIGTAVGPDGFLPFGFAPFEIVYRQRTEAEGSKYSDGMWGWRKFAYRPQDTVENFVLDDNGGAQGFMQVASGRPAVMIPIEKTIIYRTTTARGPQGRSILRNAYKSWYYAKRTEEVLAIGIERNMVGMPLGRVPADSVIAQDAAFQVMKDIVTRIKQDEQAGVVLPSDRDEHGYLYELELLSGDGGTDRLLGALAILRAWKQDILGSVLADFMGLGRDATGSRALADPKIELWQKSIEWVADVIAETQTRHVTPRLMKLNGYPRALSPTLTHSPVKETDVAALATAIKDIAGAGVPIVPVESDALVAHLSDLLGLPQPEEA